MTRGNASLQMPNPLLKAILEVRLYSVRGNLPLSSYNLAKASEQRDPQDAKNMDFLATRGGARLMRIVTTEQT